MAPSKRRPKMAWLLTSGASARRRAGGRQGSRTEASPSSPLGAAASVAGGGSPDRDRGSAVGRRRRQISGLALWDLTTLAPYRRRSGRTFPTTRPDGHTARFFLPTMKGSMSSMATLRRASYVRSRQRTSPPSSSEHTAHSVGSRSSGARRVEALRLSLARDSRANGFSHRRG